MKVSIIIPVYNPGELLYKCLDSVIGQTLEDIEIICINDGSTDNSEDILNEYCQKDSRIKVISQNNHGAGFARNVGLENAKGEYIIFIDADDWIEKNMCETLYKQAKNLDCDLILFDAVYHIENNKTRQFIHFPNNFNKNPDEFTFDWKFMKNRVFNGYFGVIWCKFYKNEFIKDNHITFENHKIYNDIEFHIKSLLLAEKIGYCPEELYHYVRIGQKSLQENYSASSEVMCFYDVMIGIRDFLISHDFMEKFRMEYLDYACYYFKTKLNQIDENYKEEFFLKIKSFMETINATPEELTKLHNEHVAYYIHVLNSKNYLEYELIQKQFDGKNLNSNISQNYIYYINKDENAFNKSYINLLENSINEKNKHADSMTQDLRNKNDKIDEINAKLSEISVDYAELRNSYDNLNKQHKEINNINLQLTKENDQLKKELDEIKSSKLWKLKNKL